MREYLTEEFFDNSQEYPIEEQIDKKVSLLYDLCILHKSKYRRDHREQAVRDLLASYATERQIDNAVHDIVVGKYTLNEALKRKGFL